MFFFFFCSEPLLLQQPRALQLQTTPPPPPPKVVQLESPKTDNGGGSDGYIQASSSRWPKAEVEALISLRTNLDLKYQENGPKGPLWEEISSAMKRIGYNRSSKRCKEKWENINKYFKKVKESNKKRPEDSKTCPYFQQLDALYKVKNKPEITLLIQSQAQAQAQFNPGLANKIENPSMVPIMVRPEQQWPLPQEQAAAGAMEEDRDSDNMEQHIDDDDEGDDDEDEGAGYEIVANKPQTMVTAGE